MLTLTPPFILGIFGFSRQKMPSDFPPRKTL
uniref:Uncharacterized protein n=1 Tax=Vibrio parahaemolyticus TaxID=670 RepID=A0A0C5H138_VIBPH|nr:hypothetical protein pVPH1_0073 [Vibrio parahaemolyticus]